MSGTALHMAKATVVSEILVPAGGDKWEFFWVAGRVYSTAADFMKKSCRQVAVQLDRRDLAPEVAHNCLAHSQVWVVGRLCR